MARIRLNASCNILTLDSTHNPRASVEITVPRFRLNLSPHEAKQLVDDLSDALEFIRTGAHHTVVAVGGKKVKP